MSPFHRPSNRLLRRAHRVAMAALTLTALVLAMATSQAAPALAETGHPSYVSPHRQVMGTVTADATGIWKDYGDEAWICTYAGIFCGDPPHRDLNGTGGDYPAKILHKDETVWIECWKGNYYLINYDIDYGDPGHFGLVVAADVAPDSDVRAPAACYNTDTPD